MKPTYMIFPIHYRRRETISLHKIFEDRPNFVIIRKAVFIDSPKREGLCIRWHNQTLCRLATPTLFPCWRLRKAQALPVLLVLVASLGLAPLNHTTKLQGWLVTPQTALFSLTQSPTFQLYRLVFYYCRTSRCAEVRGCGVSRSRASRAKKRPELRKAGAYNSDVQLERGQCRCPTKVP